MTLRLASDPFYDSPKDGTIQLECDPEFLLLLLMLLVCALFVTGCGTEESAPPIRLGINPWVGYEALHLAREKGYFEELGVSVDLVEYSSLGDVRRALERGDIDAMATTVIEVLEARGHAPVRPTIIMVTNYSDGADVILARSGVASVTDLKGKRVGAEPATLGMFMLLRSLQSEGLSMSDVTLLPLDPLEMADAFRTDRVDAVVTYPPYSLEIEQTVDTHVIFTSADIPGEIVDVVSVNAELLDTHRDPLARLIRAWDRALAFASEHPEEANAIMARRQGIPVEAFTDAMAGVRLVSSSDMLPILRESLPKLVAEIDQLLRDYHLLSGSTRRDPYCDVSPLEHASRSAPRFALRE